MRKPRAHRHCSETVDVDGEQITYCGRFADDPETRRLMDELVTAAARALRDGWQPGAAFRPEREA